MTNYVLDLISRSIAGGRVLPESDELPEQVKPRKEPPAGDTTQQAQPESRKESIALSGVFRSYANSRGSFTPALQNIDLEIEQGEFVCIVGPSG
jgi:ABC-type multidrug transport system fused ATPase/permease subunit